MALAPYTTPQLVRLALGISIKEISDDKLNLSTVSTAMVIGLREISTTLPADLKTAMEDTSNNADIDYFADMGELYCTCLVALGQTPALPMAAPKQIQDDRTSLTRDDAASGLLAGQLARQLAYLRGKLVAAYLAVEPGAVILPAVPPGSTPTIGVSTGLALDPITG